MPTATDEIETLILMAMDANHTEIAPEKLWRNAKAGEVLEKFDPGESLKFNPMLPKSAYTFDLTDHDRLFAAHPNYLLIHPSDILGEETETLMFADGILKWRGFRKLKCAPKGVSCIGKPSHWYEMHMRFVHVGGAGAYYKRVVPIDKNGFPLTAKAQGNFICTPNAEGQMLLLCASMIEDAHRTNSMLAEVKDAVELKLPVPLDDYKDAFAMRESPLTPQGRRKAIIHWVASHLRRIPDGKKTTVKKHVRGIQEFVIDGIRIRISPNART